MTPRRRSRLRSALFVAGVVATALVVRPASPMADVADSWDLCVFRGSMHPDYVEDHEQWLGRPVERAIEIIPYDTWAAVEQPRNQIRAWKGTSFRPIFTTPLLPRDGESTLAAGAKGAYDGRWRSFARTFVEEGVPDAVIRLGHELNHTFYPWSAANGREEEFAAYYRRVVDVLRSVPGTRFTFVWNVLSNVTAANVERAYPGDAYVDIVSLDLYDGSRGIADFEARWQRTLTQPYGLEWLRTFSAAHDKPVAFDEWGLIKSTNHTARDPSGDSGDDTVFIDRMIDFFDAERVAYACYFDWRTNAGWSDSRIMKGPYPAATETYRSRLGPSSGTEPLADGVGDLLDDDDDGVDVTTTVAPAPVTTSTTTGAASTTVALVVGNATTIPSKDVPLRDRLEGRGFAVRLVDDDALTPSSVDADAVVISSSVVPSKVPAWLGDEPVPILSGEAYVQTTLRLATSGRERAGHTTVTVTDGSHPVSAGGAGSRRVQSSAPMGMAAPARGADVIATSSTGEATVFAVDEGAPLTSGVAPARRVSLFFSYDSPPALTADGWALFDAAVDWLT